MHSLVQHITTETLIDHLKLQAWSKGSLPMVHVIATQTEYSPLNTLGLTRLQRDKKHAIQLNTSTPFKTYLRDTIAIGRELKMIKNITPCRATQYRMAQWSNNPYDAIQQNALYIYIYIYTVPH